MASTRAPSMSCERLRLRGEVLEERRVLDVGRVVLEVEEVALRHRDRVPGRVAVEDVARTSSRTSSPMMRASSSATSFWRRPDLGEHHRLAVAAVPSGSLREVDVGRAGERVGHDQRRRGQVVGLHVGVDAALEVAVAREHGRGHELAVVHGLVTALGQRAAVADAGRAAVADDVEAEAFEVLRSGPALSGTRSRPWSRARGWSSRSRGP